MAKKSSKRSKKITSSMTDVSGPVPKFETAEERVNFWLSCLVKGELKKFENILVDYLNTVSKDKFAKVSGLGRRTIYDLADPKKKFAPRLSTIGAICQAMLSKEFSDSQ